MQVLGDLVRLNAKRYPDKMAIIMGEHSVTCAEMNKTVNQMAHGLLSLGIKTGDRVGIWSRNCLEFVPICFAVWKCGGVIVPINFRFKVDELLYLLENAQLSMLFHSEELGAFTQEARQRRAESLLPISLSWAPLRGGTSLKELVSGQSDEEPSVEVDPASAAMIMYTSGTTGHPKGALFTHVKELLDVTSLALEGNLTYEDVMLVSGPMFHNGGISAQILPALLFGCTCVALGGSFDPDEVLSTVERHKVSVTMWVPTMLAKLVAHPGIDRYDLSSLRKIWYGSSAISDVVLDACLRVFKSDFYQFFGQTESGMLLVLKPGDHAQRSRCTGREMCGAEVRVVDENGQDTAVGGVGEILGKHRPMGMERYYGMEKETEETIRDGWIHTGDLARVEGQGYFTVVDRLKDMIISGAENIYCKEVEEVIHEHPGVEEAAVFGIPDEMWGEVVCAAVVPKEGCSISEDEIVELCASRLSSYKKPKRVEFRDALPKNPAGKVVKKLLREPYWIGKTKRV